MQFDIWHLAEPSGAATQGVGSDMQVAWHPAGVGDEVGTGVGEGVGGRVVGAGVGMGVGAGQPNDVDSVKANWLPVATTIPLICTS